METYFNNDPRIRKWINQIIERIFTVCILTGVDSDEEFQKGCQVVMELTSLLQDIATFPSEFLEDGVKQLLEQQLPDPLVINNFSEFKVIMDRMLREGIMKATSVKDISVENNDSDIDSSIHTKADEEALAEALAQVETHKADGERLAEALAQAEVQAKADEEALAQVETQAKVDALAIADALAQVERSLDALIKTEHYEVAKPMPDTNDITVPALLTSINSKISLVLSAPLIPHKADLLGKVLSNIFPKSTVYWNKRLMGQTFLAQVDDILICLHDPEHPCNLIKFNKDGWKVLVCSNEDLAFPRRLEREIKQILRSGKKSATV